MKYLYFLMVLGLLIVPQVQGQVDQRSLNIMSYNIRHGFGLDSIQDLSRAAAVINSYSPDLCAIQEIDQACRRTDRINQTSYLAEKTRLAGTFGKFMDYDGGAYGMANLVKLPVAFSRCLPLPDGIQEPRSSLVQQIRVTEEQQILFANVHFDWVSGEAGERSRLQQAKALVAYLNSSQKAVIITGDFNCTPQSPTMKYFEEQGFVFVAKGGDRLSFQGPEKAEIDHLIYRNSEEIMFSVIQVKLLDEPLVSDHRPLITELEVSIIKK